MAGQPTKYDNHRRNKQDYLFAYGSLICAQSRAKTAPTVARRGNGIPVLVKNVERVWAKRSAQATYMGVHFRTGAECVGLLLQVTEEEVLQFDQREMGYQRLKLCPKDIHPVPYLNSKYANYNDLQPGEWMQSCNFWIYKQLESIPADPLHPILQSYVDILLRGCWDISEEFVHEFLATTKGWNPADVSFVNENGRNDDDRNEESAFSSWINDRDKPIYIRADRKYSSTMAQELDDLLQEHCSSDLQRRRKIYKFR